MFQVSGGALAAAAETAQEIAAQTRATDISPWVARLAAALPGGVTAAAADGLAGRWAAATTKAAAAMGHQAQHLQGAAVDYDAADRAVAARLRVMLDAHAG